ncbi:helix-turn-helix domain-containing protein [Paenibacillus alginolyticus]|uniref:helix-turn-helix domain-containing protein n=1 Tax=Paenibacillus alginolyticus TaxID=59839 RepID=UPI000423BF7D|nr:helix-turn-helix domain-containing protein [Paenibacillus alginolyticus]MCY9667200.1 helix-turn-helix domain-containing protein [Paenibacillus alginolyticus]
MRTSISGKAMMIYGIVFLFIIALTFWLSYVGTVGRLQKDLQDANLALLKQVDSKIEAAFRQTEKDLLSMAERLEFVYFMNNSYSDDGHRYSIYYSLTNRLKEFISNNPNYSSVFAYSHVSGDLMTEETYLKQASSEFNWLAQYLDMPEYYKWLSTQKVWDGQETQDVITLVRSFPSLSSPGFRKGLMAVSIKEAQLFQMIKAIYEDGHAGQFFILDAEGNVVTHDDKNQLYRNMKSLPYIQTILMDPDSGSFNVKLDGIQESVFYRTSGYTGWKFISIMPESTVFEPIKVTRNLLLTFAVVMFFLALAALFYVNRWTFKPLDRLAGKLSGVNKGRGQGAKRIGLRNLEHIFDEMVTDREHLEQHVRDSKPMLKWKIMMDVLNGNRSDFHAMYHHLEFLGIHMYSERFIVCTAEIGKEGERLTPRDETLYTYMFCNVAEELIRTEHAGLAIDLGGGRAAVLLSFAEGDAEQNHLRTLVILELILDIMKRQFGLMVTVGVGKCRMEMKEIPSSFDESQKALHYKMIFGKHSVISVDDLQPPDRQDYYKLSRMIDPVMEAMRQIDRVKMLTCLSDTFREAVESNLPPELIRQLCYDLVMKSLQTVKAIGIEPEISMGPLSSFYDRIGKCENWKDAERLVGDILEGLASQIEEKRTLRGKNETIERMLDYIREHYQEYDLSLDRLAEMFHLTPPYISRLFKEHTESNFIDYMIEIRIKAAMELLKDKSIKVNDVSGAVGYANTRSFLRTFKKYTGLTPTEYREHMSKPIPS